MHLFLCFHEHREEHGRVHTQQLDRFPRADVSAVASERLSAFGLRIFALFHLLQQSYIIFKQLFL